MATSSKNTSTAKSKKPPSVAHPTPAAQAETPSEAIENAQNTSNTSLTSLLPPPPKRTKAPNTRQIQHPGNGIPGDPEEFTTAAQRARPTKRSELIYRRYQEMGQARTLPKLAERIALEDWASEHYYRQTRGEPMDAFYRRMRKELEKAGAQEMETLFRHRAAQLKTLQRWSALYDWQQRVAAWDQEQADILERETLMARIDMNKRQATAAAVLHQESFNYTRDLIKDGKLQGRDAVSAFLGAATQERVALGASTSIQEQRGKLGLGVTQQGAQEVNIHQEVDVHGNVTVSHEHSGAVQVQVTQLNVDVLRLLQDAAAPQGQASLQWRQALGLLTSGNTGNDAHTVDAAPGALPAVHSGPSYQSLGAWVVPPELAPDALTTTALQATASPQPIPAAADAPIVDSTPPSEQLPAPPQHVALTSSDLASASYDAATATLEITFLSGATYRYNAVPQEVYDGLVTSESAGGFFHAHIRGAFAYERIG